MKDGIPEALQGVHSIQERRQRIVVHGGVGALHLRIQAQRLVEQRRADPSRRHHDFAILQAEFVKVGTTPFGKYRWR